MRFLELFCGFLWDFWGFIGQVHEIFSSELPFIESEPLQPTPHCSELLFCYLMISTL